MLTPFALLPFISNTTSKFDSTVPCLVSVTPLYFCTRFHTVRLFSVMLLGDAYAWATPSTLATPYLGDAFFLGDAHAWRRLLSWRRVCLVMLVATSKWKKIMTETKARFFSNFFFFFIWVTSLKKPRKGKRVCPSTTLLHGCLHKSTKIKFQVGCIPAAQNGAPFQGL